MGLIAKVTVVAMVDGQRQEFQPGAELPALHEHDVASLKAMGAIEDTGETEKAAKTAALAEKAAGKAFAAARKAVQAADESTDAGVAGPQTP